MKEAFWGYFLIIAGITVIAVLMLFQDLTNTNDQDYYLLKETTEAAMIDSFDIPYYRKTGKIRIDKEKFVEMFTKRFANSVNRTRDYKLDFNDIVEYPPKVSVTVSSKSRAFSMTGDEFTIRNHLDTILETNFMESNNDI